MLLPNKRFAAAAGILILLVFVNRAPLPVLSAVFIIALLFNPHTLRPLKNFKFWLVISLLVIIVPLYTGEKNAEFLNIRYSQDQLQAMFLMSVRGIGVFLLFQVLSTNLNSEKLRRTLGKLGIKHADDLITLSSETLPSMHSILKARLAQYQQKNKRKFIPVRELLSFSLDVLEDMISLTEHLSRQKNDKEELSPAILADKIVKADSPHLVLVCGDPGSGKSPYLSKLFRQLKKYNKSVNGIICHKIRESSNTWHHQMEILSSGERFQMNSMNEINGSIKVGKFNFLPNIFELAHEKLSPNLNSDFLIIDEIGLLEIKGKKGFFHLLSVLDRDYRGTLIISIRKHLCANLNEFLGTNLPKLAEREKCIVSLSDERKENNITNLAEKQI